MKRLAPFLLLASSCAMLKPLPKQLIDCGEQAVFAQVPTLIPAAEAALGQHNWGSALDSLISASGNAAICALHDVVADLESQANSSTLALTTASLPLQAPGLAPNLLYSRGCAYLAADGYRFK